MPHAEPSKMANNSNPDSVTNGKMTNGDQQPRSQFISHLTSYPVVSDTLTTYKQNPYGAKSLDLISQFYASLAGPVIPYIRGPVSLVAPYLAKADSLGDNGLSSLESRFPIVKADTATVRDKVTDVAVTPLRLAGQGRDYVFKTYQDELHRACNGGKPKDENKDSDADAKATLYKQARAVIATEIHLAMVVVGYMLEVMKAGGQLAREQAEKRTGNADTKTA